MARYHACGVPRADCNGANKQTDACGRAALKVHASPPEAFECYKRYMVHVIGYKITDDARLLEAPDGSLLILTKRSKFGCEFRLSKHNKGIGTRVRPVHKCITGS